MLTESQAETSPNNDDVDNSVSELTAGDVLRQKRQHLGLSEKEVADKLHITMHYVKALENNHYEKLPATVFAKGYIKSYALLLGLEEDDLLTRYDEFNTQKQENIAEASRVKAQRKKDRNKPFVIVSLLVFVGGFLGLWLANSYFGEESTPDALVVAETDSNDASVIQVPVREGVQQAQVLQEATETLDSHNLAVLDTTADSEQAINELALLEDISVPPVLTEGIPVVSVNDVTTASQSSSATLLSPDSEDSVLEEIVELEVSSADSELLQVIEIEAVGNDVLRISFSGECWVEVNDSEAQQIYRDIREAGDILEITGSAPFNILLGDAFYAEMTLNGVGIDFSDDIRIDNSARLTVGL
jgi:cytoskeleton protein RodZ